MLITACPGAGLPLDVGPEDGAQTDAGLDDRAAVDVMAGDGASSDTGVADSGAADTGSVDSRTADAAPGEAGTVDSGSGDGGSDAGPTLRISDYVPFRDEGGAQRYFDYVRMVDGSIGYATEATFASELDLYQTLDGGETWTLIGTVATGNSGNGASYHFMAYDDELWFTTYFSGFGITGTIGVSRDRGQGWTRFDDTIHALYDDYNEPFTTLARVREEGLHAVLVREGRDSLALSSDGGDVWTRHDLATRGGSLLATDGALFMWANETSSTDDWNFYRYDPGADSFTGYRGDLPGDFWLTRWYAAPLQGVITLVDNESSHTPERSAQVTTDGSGSFYALIAHGADGDADGFRLERAMGLEGGRGFACTQSQVATRIQGTSDGSQTWQILAELNDTTYIYYFIADLTGNVYAVRFSAYSVGFYRL